MKKKLVSILLSMAMCASFATPLSMTADAAGLASLDDTGFTTKTTKTESKVDNIVGVVRTTSEDYLTATASSIGDMTANCNVVSGVTVHLGKFVPTEHIYSIPKFDDWASGSSKTVAEKASVNYTWYAEDESGNTVQNVKFESDENSPWQAKATYSTPGKVIIKCKVDVSGNGYKRTKVVTVSGDGTAYKASDKDYNSTGEWAADSSKTFSNTLTNAGLAITLTKTSIDSSDVKVKDVPASSTLYKDLAAFTQAWSKKKKPESANMEVKAYNNNSAYGVSGSEEDLTLGTDYAASVVSNSLKMKKSEMVVVSGGQLVALNGYEKFNEDFSSLTPNDVNSDKLGRVATVQVKVDGKGSYDGTTNAYVKVNVLPKEITITGESATVTESSFENASDNYEEDEVAARTDGVIDAKNLKMVYGDVNKTWFSGETSILRFDEWTAAQFGNAKATEVKFSSSDKKVAKVDKKGVVTAKGVGKTTITITLKKNTTVKKDVTLEVIPKNIRTLATASSSVINFGSAKDVKLAKSYKDYNAFKDKFIAKAVKKFVVHNGKKKLKGADDKSKDFTVKVTAGKEDDEAYVKIEGTKNYTGFIEGWVDIPYETQQLCLYYDVNNTKDLDGFYKDTINDVTYGDTFDVSSLIKDEEDRSSYERLGVTNTSALKKSKKIKYKTADKSIAKINGKGKLTAKAAGKVNIEVWPAKNDSAKAILTLNIQKKKFTQDWVPSGKTIKGKALSVSEAKSNFKPERVVLKDGKKKLKYGTDFTVVIKDCKDGQLTFYCKGAGNYDSGSTTADATVSYDQKTT